jgi:hypothetical protein
MKCQNKRKCLRVGGEGRHLQTHIKHGSNAEMGGCELRSLSLPAWARPHRKDVWGNVLIGNESLQLSKEKFTPVLGDKFAVTRGH